MEFILENDQNNFLNKDLTYAEKSVGAPITDIIVDLESGIQLDPVQRSQ